MNVKGARAGWYSIMPPGMDWDNRVGPAIAIDMLGYRAAQHARRIRCPFLVCVSDKETLMDPRIAVRAAKAAPQGKAIHYAADHFEVYHPPIVEAVVRDQIAFLQVALGIEEPASQKRLVASQSQTRS